MFRILRQAKPAYVLSPRNRPTLSKAIGKPSQGLGPPDGLANHPRPPSATRITKLRKNTPRNYSNCKGQRTTYQRAPELVPGMTMMNVNLITRLPGIMVTDGNNRREEHVVIGCYTLKAVVRFFVHVEESRFKAGQFEINRSAQNRSRVSKRTG